MLGKIASLVEDNDDNFDELIDNFHYYLISILIHLNDESPVVKQSCIKALSIIANLLKNQELWYYKNFKSFIIKKILIISFVINISFLFQLINISKI